MKLAKNILITGRPRVGKTTLIRRLTDLLDERAGGFYTEEVAGEGVRGRRGFKIITLDGREGTLADVSIRSRFSVGKYGVNMDDLDNVGVDALQKAIDERQWVVVDEIGKMEEFSEHFRETIVRALDSERRVLATIRLNDSPFTKGIKERSDVTLIKLTVPMRDEVRQSLEAAVLSSKKK